jgi:hypothetical protein
VNKNKVNLRINKTIININIHDHTVQNEQREYNAYIDGASSIGMDSNLSNKNPKERNKTQKPDGSYPTIRLTCKCGEASLSSRRTAPNTLIHSPTYKLRIFE